MKIYTVDSYFTIEAENEKEAWQEMESYLREVVKSKKIRFHGCADAELKYPRQEN